MKLHSTTQTFLVVTSVISYSFMQTWFAKSMTWRLVAMCLALNSWWQHAFELFDFVWGGGALWISTTSFDITIEFMVNMLANNVFFTHLADTEQQDHSFHVAFVFHLTNDFNIHPPRTSSFLSTNSRWKYQFFSCLMSSTVFHS